MKRIIIIAGLLVVIIGGIILASYIGLHKPETTLLPEIGVSSQVTVEVNKYIFIKMVSSDQKVAVYVPPNSTWDEGYFVLTAMEPNIFTDPEAEWKRPIVVSLILYDKDGKIVDEPTLARVLDICFLMDNAERTEYLEHPENYSIQYYEENQNEKKWVNMRPSLKSNDQQLCGEIDHMGLFSLTTKGNPQIIIPASEPYSP